MPDNNSLLKKINDNLIALTTEAQQVNKLVLKHEEDLYGEGAHLGLRAIRVPSI